MSGKFFIRIRVKLQTVGLSWPFRCFQIPSKNLRGNETLDDFSLETTNLNSFCYVSFKNIYNGFQSIPFLLFCIHDAQRWIQNWNKTVYSLFVLDASASQAWPLLYSQMLNWNTKFKIGIACSAHIHLRECPCVSFKNLLMRYLKHWFTLKVFSWENFNSLLLQHSKRINFFVCICHDD